jgi:uncharacterized protein
MRLPALASLVFAVLALMLAVQPARAALTFPAQNGQRVVDDAHVLSPDAVERMARQLAALQQATSRQLVVVTLPSLQGDDIADYGYQLGRAWGIGQKGTNNGALFIVVPSEHKVRIEVGYGLEGVLTDAMTSVILQRAVLPRFKAGDIPGGVEAGTAAIVQQMGLDTSTAEQRAAEAQQSVAVQRRTAAAHGRGASPLGAVVVFFVLGFVILSVLRGGGGGLGGFLGGMFLGSLLGGGGRRYDDDGWGGGGGGNDNSGGGGGGGSFGGGGSSGSW